MDERDPHIDAGADQRVRKSRLTLQQPKRPRRTLSKIVTPRPKCYVVPATNKIVFSLSAFVLEGQFVVDLYAVLGVARDADQKTIRRAFRKGARAAHPDGGGSVEAFSELKTAYDVLSDPIQRGRYDETGEFGEPNADPHRKKLIEILSLGLDQALLKLSGSSKSESDSNLVRLMTEALVVKRVEFSNQLKSFEKALDDARRIEDRFLVTDGENLMAVVIAGRISACERQIELLAERVKLIDEATAILHSTRFDAPLKLTSGQKHAYTYLDVSALART